MFQLIQRPDPFWPRKITFCLPRSNIMITKTWFGRITKDASFQSLGRNITLSVGGGFSCSSFWRTESVDIVLLLSNDSQATFSMRHFTEINDSIQPFIWAASTPFVHLQIHYCRWFEGFMVSRGINPAKIPTYVYILTWSASGLKRLAMDPGSLANRLFRVQFKNDNDCISHLCLGYKWYYNQSTFYQIALRFAHSVVPLLEIIEWDHSTQLWS